MSFGEQGRFQLRDTAPLPTKSAVLGLVRCCQGLGTNDPIGPLADTRLGVRADRAGQPLSDLHTLTSAWVTANEPDPWKIATGKPGTRLTIRDYLADAAFTVALEHPDADLLAELDHALMQPAFLPYIGRKSCVVSLPLRPPQGGIRDTCLSDALYEEPLIDERHDRNVTLETELPAEEAWDKPAGPVIDRPDQPSDESVANRMHHSRPVRRETVPADRFPAPTDSLEAAV